MRFRRSFARRERSEWLGAIQVTPVSVAVNAQSIQTLITSSSLEEFSQPRIARVMGQLFISPATAPAAATGYGVFVGIAKLRVAGGAQATPDPETTPEYRWTYWNSVFPQIGGTAAADSNAARWIGYFRMDIHLATRWRADEFDTVQMFVKNSNSSGASIQFSYALRFLIQAGRK